MARAPSKRDLYRLALNHAIDERDSFVESHAHMPNDPAAVRARELSQQFRELLAKDYGETCTADQIVEETRRMAPVPIAELMRGGPPRAFKEPAGDS